MTSAMASATAAIESTTIAMIAGTFEARPTAREAWEAPVAA
jgi:hypothetical protein